MMMKRVSLLVLVTLLTPGAAAAQSLTGTGVITQLPTPVKLDIQDRFTDAADRVGDNVYVSGQPTARALRELRDSGVSTVVNLRTPSEMQRDVPFDEGALVKSLGMNYVSIPVRGDSLYPYSPEAVAQFADAMRSARGKVLLHCTVGWRASHLWAAYLIKDRGVPTEEALANARAINLMDSHHMAGDKRQPVEAFLDQDLPMLGHGGR